MVLYIRVSEEEDMEPVELPLEDDGTLLLSTLSAQYPGTCGLKYRNPETRALRGLRVVDGRLYCPQDGWQNTTYICVISKEDKWKPDDSPEIVLEKPKEPRKTCSDLIVLGLPWKTTETELRMYFETYGDVILAQVKKDPKSGQPKGFGFIRFSDYDTQQQVLAQRHMINERWCDVKIPNSKIAIQQQQQQHGGVGSIWSMPSGSPTPHVPCKVFVGRCTEDMTTEDLREYFEEFGEVTDVFIPKPFRAFAFVTFTDPDVAQKLCGENYIIKGTSVHVSSAAPKTDPNNRTPWGRGPGGRGFESERGVQPWEPWVAPREFPNLSALGSSLGISQDSGTSGAGGGQGQNGATAGMGPGPVNLGALPMNSALVAALNQTNWGVLSNLQQEGGPPQGGGYQSSYPTQAAPPYSSQQGYAGGNQYWMNQVDSSVGAPPSSSSQVPVWQQRDNRGNRYEW